MTLFIDIESVAPPPNADLGLFFKPPGNIKDPAKIEARREEFVGTLSLHHWASEPVSIAWAFDDDKVQCEGREKGESAEDFFARWGTWFDSTITRHDQEMDECAGWNVLFDVRAIRLWSMRYGVRTKFAWPKRKYDRRLIDVMELVSPGELLSMRKAIYAMDGIAYSDQGNQVAELWRQDRMPEIMEHNRLDVMRTRDLYNLACSYG